MSQERWDIVLRFLSGPLALQGDLVLRGPVVRLGANPGPGGLSLDGYRGVDDRQAVITAYDGGTVSVAPVGKNQVRVNTHENVDWESVQPLNSPVFLSKGDAVHVGPANRGATFLFVDARPLRFTQSAGVYSDAAQAQPYAGASNVVVKSTTKGMPAWFVPSLIGMGLITVVTVFSLTTDVFRTNVKRLGPAVDGEEQYARVELSEEVIQQVETEFKGFDQAFEYFVMIPNAKAAEWPELRSDRKLWDDKYVLYTKASVGAHARANNFWRRLDAIEERYHEVVVQARKAGLPDILAGIPYQESSYRAEANSPVCAKGWWQLMPEVAHRVKVEVRNCKLSGSDRLWSPTRVSPVIGVLKHAEYVGREGGYRCKLGSCEVDMRADFDESTRGAMELLKEPWVDEELRASGALVQITILSHNAGYDNSRFEEKRVNNVNILPSYRRHLQEDGLKRDPAFYGKNITCVGEEHKDILGKANDKCDGHIANQSQHYAYSITAQHILAACYYAQNYPDKPIWKEYKQQFYSDDGYCTTLNVPDFTATAPKR